MTLWLPILDQARSYRALISRMPAHVPPHSLVCSPGTPVGLLTAMEYFGAGGKGSGDGPGPDAGDGARKGRGKDGGDGR